MAQQQQQIDAAALKLEDPAGPSVWEAAAQHKGSIPDTEWEYQVRKNLRDAAFTTLDYVPACTHVPVCAAGCTAPRYVWVSICKVHQCTVCDVLNALVGHGGAA